MPFSAQAAVGMLIDKSFGSYVEADCGAFHRNPVKLPRYTCRVEASIAAYERPHRDGRGPAVPYAHT